MYFFAVLFEVDRGVHFALSGTVNCMCILLRS